MPKTALLTLSALALCVALLLTILPGQPAALGSPLDPPDWYSDRDMEESARIGDVLYIGGAFQWLSATPEHRDVIPRNHIAAFDVRTGALLDWQPPSTLAEVKVLEAGLDHIYIVGSFSDRPGKNLHALDPATNIVTSWAIPINGIDSIYDMVFYNGRIIFPGYKNDMIDPSLLVLDTQTGQITPWADLIAGTVFEIVSMIMHHDRLYISGTFEIYRPHPEDTPPELIPAPQVNLAAFDLATGELTDWLPIVGPPAAPLNQREVIDLAAYNDTLYISGEFTSIDGQPRAGLAAFSTLTGQLRGWNQSITSEGWWLAVDQHRLVAWTLGDGSVIRSFHSATGEPLGWSLAMSWPIGLHMAGDLLFAYGTGESTQDPELIIAPLPAASPEGRARVYLPMVE